MTIRYSHNWKSRPNKLIWMEVTTHRKGYHYRPSNNATSIFFKYKRYENGRKGFQMFLEKWIHFIKQTQTDSWIAIEKFYRHFYRSGAIKKTIKISPNGTIGNTSYSLIVKRKSQQTFSQNCRLMSKVESRIVEMITT